MEKEIVKSNVEVQVASPVNMAQMLLEKGIDPADLEKMLALEERYEARQANKAYCREMAVVQMNIPSVKKTLRNNQTNSKYEDLQDIINQTKKIYTERGFSVSFYEGDSPHEEHIRIYADVRHSEGHKETYHYDMPLDGKGIKGNVNMTKIHGKGSATSYARRYLMRMIWNIPTGDDTDGNVTKPVEYIDEKQLSHILDFLDDTELNIDRKRFLDFYKVASVEELPKKLYDQVIIALVTRKNLKKGETK